jgi:hypothetical protein
MLLMAWQGLNLELPGAEGLLKLIINIAIKDCFNKIA